jgi:hypothetical protein
MWTKEGGDRQKWRFARCQRADSRAQFNEQSCTTAAANSPSAASSEDAEIVAAIAASLGGYAPTGVATAPQLHPVRQIPLPVEQTSTFVWPDDADAEADLAAAIAASLESRGYEMQGTGGTVAGEPSVDTILHSLDEVGRCAGVSR